jgi:uncharacterized protein
MKSLLILFVAIISTCFPISAQEIDKMPMITVTGTAEVMVEPDEVIFSLDVTKIDKDLQIAKRLNDETVSKVLELTRRFSVQPQNVKTDYISVEMIYESVRDPKKRFLTKPEMKLALKFLRVMKFQKR